MIENSSKQRVWSWDHYAYGDNAPNQNPFGLGTFNYNLRYPGQYKDAEAGLNYNGQRDSYDSTTGRYHQSDPLGLQAGINTYGYGAANPLTNIDPKGLECVTTNGSVKCWTTAQERRFLNSGDYIGYYNQACADGDTYACFAEQVATNTGFWANQANDRLIAALKREEEQDHICLNISADLEKIRSELANDYANYLPNSEANAITPSATSIAKFHWAVFNQFGLDGSTFGGTPFVPWYNGPIGQHQIVKWCPDCIQ